METQSGFARVTDAAIYKFSRTGELIYVTYLCGGASEKASAIKLAGDSLLIAGNTDSTNFPVTANAYQRSYAGPPAAPPSDAAGDFFAARLDPATGELTAATFAGGPDKRDTGNCLCGRGCSVHLIAKAAVSPRLPVTSGVIRPACTDDPCLASYVISLDAPLSRSMYATYLPGIPFTTDLHPDGSLSFFGRSGPAFP